MQVGKNKVSMIEVAPKKGIIRFGMKSVFFFLLQILRKKTKIAMGSGLCGLKYHHGLIRQKIHLLSPKKTKRDLIFLGVLFFHVEHFLILKGKFDVFQFFVTRC